MEEALNEDTNSWDKVAGYNLNPGNLQESDYAHKYIILPRLRALLPNDFVEAHSIEDVPILDVGCGNGILACDLVMEFPGLNLVGIDSSSGMIQRAKKNISYFLREEEGTQVDFIEDDAKKLSFGDASFQVILQIMLLQTVDDEGLERIIAETSRVLKPTGACYVVIPNSDAIGRFRNLEQADTFDESLLNKRLSYNWRNQSGEVVATTDFFVRTVEFYTKLFVRYGFSLSVKLEPMIENTNDAYVAKKHIFLRNIFEPMFVILKFVKVDVNVLKLVDNES